MQPSHSTDTCLRTSTLPRHVAGSLRKTFWQSQLSVDGSKPQMVCMTLTLCLLSGISGSERGAMKPLPCKKFSSTYSAYQCLTARRQSTTVFNHAMSHTSCGPAEHVHAGLSYKCVCYTRMGSHRVQIRQKAAALDAEEAKRRFQVGPGVQAIQSEHLLHLLQQLE